MDNELLMKLYGTYQKELYLYLYSLCRNRHQAEDLLHETFLKALLALPDGHTNMRAWLYMVARNLFYNQQKKRSKEILSEGQDAVTEDCAKGDLLENILAEENRRMLYRALQNLDLKKTRDHSDAVFRRNVTERDCRSFTYYSGECPCAGISGKERIEERLRRVKRRIDR